MLLVLAIMPNLLVWSCLFILLDSLLKQPPNCEFWCSEQGTLDSVALLVLVLGTLTTFLATPVLFVEAGRRSKAAWFAVTSTVLQPVVFLGILPVILRSLRAA